MRYASRNHTLGFAERTRKNLEYIEAAFSRGEDVHVVTQLVTSLLGLVVFPWEKKFGEYVYTLKLDQLATKGWPQWQMVGRDCETLGQLLRLLRNAVAHGNLVFSSDSRHIEEVTVELENYPTNGASPDWLASIPATELRSFCYRFVDLVDQVVG